MNLLSSLSQKEKALAATASFVLLIIIVFAIIILTDNDPEDCIEYIDEDTGETIIECPNRDPEAYEPEEGLTTDELSQFEETLPIYQNYYEIDYRPPFRRDEGKVSIIIRTLTREFPPPPASASSDSPEVKKYKDHIREHRRVALDRLEDIGFEDDLYDIFYNEDYLIDEFPGEYWADEKIRRQPPESEDAYGDDDFFVSE